MKESQIIEFKESWRDEHIKSICAFANSKGGTLIIGIKDNGDVKGINDSKKLLEDIPNKVVQLLGITVEIVSKRKKGKDIVEIHVPHNQVPVSYHGRFYIRSGSTVQELQGRKLRDFILRKDNVCWDSSVIQDASFDDLDERLIRYFINKAIEKNRLPADAKLSDSFQVLQKLNLINSRNELTRAAILLFAKSPSKFLRGVACKIGRFGKDSTDIISHDIIECPLFEMPDKIMDLLKAKYIHPD